MSVLYAEFYFNPGTSVQNIGKLKLIRNQISNFSKIPFKFSKGKGALALTIIPLGLINI